jgi:hypothetical protein
MEVVEIGISLDLGYRSVAPAPGEYYLTAAAELAYIPLAAAPVEGYKPAAVVVVHRSGRQARSVGLALDGSRRFVLGKLGMGWLQSTACRRIGSINFALD